LRQSIRVLIADENRVVREGIAVLLASTDVEVVGCTRDGAEARDAVGQVQPDIVLAVGSKQGIALTRELTRAYPGLRVVILGVSEAASEVIEAVEAGAAGYLLNDSSLEEFSNSLRAIAEGETPCPPKVVATLFSRLANLAGEREGSGRAGGRSRLTSREIQILGLVAEGLSNKEIASRLQVEIQTVKNHVHNILEKLEVHDRLDAAKRAMHLGLFPRTASSATNGNNGTEHPGAARHGAS
jgi:DNA-binding NarL/FixJ family response regulator